MLIFYFIPPQVRRFCSNTRCMGQEQRGVPSPLAMQIWEHPPLSREQGWAAVEENMVLNTTTAAAA